MKLHLQKMKHKWRRGERETVQVISTTTAVINAQSTPSFKTDGEEGKELKHVSKLSSSDKDNPVKNKQVSDFDCAAACPVDMSCSSVSAGKPLCLRDCLSTNFSCDK